MIEVNGKYTNAKIMIDQIEPECMGQIIQMINHESFTNPVRIMPDTHSGAGSVIGFTMPVGNKLVPNVVGVDISCGMLSYNVGKINLNHKELDEKIREEIPFGININKKGTVRLDKEYEFLSTTIDVPFNYVINSIGTLGGGNHFIEIGRSQNTEDIWITVHSGSRHLGKKVCEYWQKIASRIKIYGFGDQSEGVKKIKDSYPKSEWEIRIKEFHNNFKKIKNHPLDFLENKAKDRYLEDMKLCQAYAELNRNTIMKNILSILGTTTVHDVIETVHNYIDFKDNIIRKGAIRSYIGERMIIPFNMRDGILICEGKSNPDWNFSAPHGAGRVYSRSKAKSELSIKKFENDMNGIFSTSVCRNTLDESPDAYKDSKVIEKAIEPTAKILDRIIPIHNMKDVNDEKPWKR